MSDPFQEAFADVLQAEMAALKRETRVALIRGQIRRRLNMLGPMEFFDGVSWNTRQRYNCFNQPRHGR